MRGRLGTRLTRTGTCRNQPYPSFCVASNKHYKHKLILIYFILLWNATIKLSFINSLAIYTVFLVFELLFCLCTQIVLILPFQWSEHKLYSMSFFMFCTITLITEWYYILCLCECTNTIMIFIYSMYECITIRNTRIKSTSLFIYLTINILQMCYSCFSQSVWWCQFKIK